MIASKTDDNQPSNTIAGRNLELTLFAGKRPLMLTALGHQEHSTRDCSVFQAPVRVHNADKETRGAGVLHGGIPKSKTSAKTASFGLDVTLHVVHEAAVLHSLLKFLTGFHRLSRLARRRENRKGGVLGRLVSTDQEGSNVGTSSRVECTNLKRKSTARLELLHKKLENVLLGKSHTKVRSTRTQNALDLGKHLATLLHRRLISHKGIKCALIKD
mmetsp:Transcript_1915/g.4363  ORF Transcript_1915/g.4363 Transcript_1915/m.4363 type:complete len:215 (-) Transcript_1915:768-1412(-)